MPRKPILTRIQVDISESLDFTFFFDGKEQPFSAEEFSTGSATRAQLEALKEKLSNRFSPLRRCELCGEFMDLNLCARPGVKRAHFSCRHTESMRRYRARKKEGI